MQRRGVPDVEDLTQEMLVSDQQEATAAYLNSGRSLQLLSDEDLQSNWASAFRKMVRERSASSFRQLGDATAELALREIEPEVTRIQPEMEIVRREIANAGPDDPAVVDKVRQFIESRAKSGAKN